MNIFFFIPVILTLIAVVSSFPFLVTPHTNQIMVDMPGFTAPNWRHGPLFNIPESVEVYVYRVTPGYNRTYHRFRLQGFDLAREIEAFVRNTSDSFIEC